MSDTTPMNMSDGMNMDMSGMGDMPGMKMDTPGMKKDMPGMSDMPGMNNAPGMDNNSGRTPPGITNTAQNSSSGSTYTLAQIRKLAEDNNPTLIQARAQIAGEKGKALQAGLFPNPSIGWVGDLMGDRAGPLGEMQGGGIQQDIILGGKLKYSRKKYQARVDAAEAQFRSQKLRVLNDVDVAFYKALAAAKRLELQQELERSAHDRWLTRREMANLGEANEADLLQAEIYWQRQKVHVQIAQTNYQTSWQQICAYVGKEIPQGDLSGNLEEPDTDLQWTAALQRIIAESPELAEAKSKLRSDEITVQRERRQPWPNLSLASVTGYDQQGKSFATSASVALTNVPVFNRNQGTIQQAEADLERQKAQVRLVELQLKQSLSEFFRYYSNARNLVQTYRTSILPQSRKRYQICLDSYRNTRLDWNAVLEAQNDYFSNRVAYVDYLVDLQAARVRIEGFLLSGGLTAPPGVTPPGHIDATPQPR